MEENSFITNENKGMLWSLMYDNGLFSKISSTYIENIKALFENEIINVDKKFDSTIDIVSKNKEVLRIMTNKIKQLPNISELPVTAEDVQKKRQQQFENNLTLRQNEFNQMISKPIPNHIDFSDEADTPIKGDIDKILTDVIAKRDVELKQITPSNNKTSNNVETIRSLKIGDTILEDIESSTKHVSFDDNVEDISHYRYKSKTSIPDISEPILNEEKKSLHESLQAILKQLQIITNTQKQIVELLGTTSNIETAGKNKIDNFI